MIDSLTGNIAGKVLEFLVKEFAGRKIDEWLPDQDKKKTFTKALEAALDRVADEGFSIKGPGALDDSFLTSEVVKEELWAKLLDPTIDEEINYSLLEEELRAIYRGVPISDREADSIEFFVDALMDEMWQQASLRDLIYGKILHQHDRRLSLRRKKALVLDYLKVEGNRIEAQLHEELGEGNRYVEPLIEKKTKKTDGERVTDKLLSGEMDSFAPVDPNTYFTEGPEDKVVVVADSGYGKTTLLRRLFLRISKSFEAEPFGTHSFIPIFLTPSQAAECSETNIENKVKVRLMVSRCREGKVRQFVQDEFGKGNLIFLIDALDQVVNKENLRGALSGSAFGKNRVVVTVRPNVWNVEKGHLHGYACVLLREFNQSRWEEYLGKERLAALQEVVDQVFLSVPILLRLIVEYWLKGMKKTECVKSRSELYSKMFHGLLKRPEDSDAVEALTKDPRNPLDARDDLYKLAHDALAAGYLGQLPRSYAKRILDENKLRDLEARRGILRILETEEEIAFRHRSFQEYLTAEYLKSNIKSKDDLSKLEPYLYHANWEESMRFLAGLLDPKSAEYLVDMILNAAKGRLLFLYRDHLRVASLCLREMGEVGQSQRETIIDELRKDLHDPVLQDTAISILATLRDKQAVDILNFLLSHKDVSVRASAAEALGWIRSEKAIEALIQALQDKDASVRERAVDALGGIGFEKATEALIQALQDEDASVRWIAAGSLGVIGSEKAVEALIQALQDEDVSVRESAAGALGEIRSEKATEALIQALQDKDGSVRWTAAGSLGVIGSEKGVEALIQALQDEDASVRWRAAGSLAVLDVSRIQLALMDMWQRESPGVNRFFLLEGIRSYDRIARNRELL
jgi:HEAT repeat protein